MKIVILKPNESGKSAFVSVEIHVGPLKSNIVGNVLITSPVKKGDVVELPEGMKATTRVSSTIDEASGEVKSCTWIVLQ